ncbi:MAG: Holliday junction branch migration protein RuvA [Nitrospirae bacterium]|nr:Holliday junction branch migration protein RuvA [Nitrospirota bacterium]NTW67080.1 Holliday junction branch migration protein RuvA [Nitrospirota bacterium]
MIAWLRGSVQRKTADSVIIDVSGVGYLVTIPVSTLGSVPEPGNEISLHIHTHLREDSLSLFGFATELEKGLFQLLLGVSGIGPKLALSVLSGLAAPDLLAVIGSADDERLCAIPGIGKKTAARLCLELKDKVRQLAPAAQLQTGAGAPVLSGHLDDAVSALVNLGYKRSVAEDAVKKIDQGRPDLRIEDLIREALSMLMKH